MPVIKRKSYKNYKPSDIEWLGEIPEHWNVLPIKRLTAIPVTDGPHETPELFDDGIPFISAEAIKKDKIDFSKKCGFISLKEHKRFSQKYKPLKGDIYLVKSGATTGNVAVVETDDEFNIWSPLAVIRPDNKNAITSYVFFFMKSNNFFQSIELSWSYGTQQNIGMGVIENLPIAIPPLKEQRVIAEFLDRETGRIDGLIEKKERQIELLKEKRSALISHAVTKGLNPNANMKPSGIEWLGEIPETWDVIRVKALEMNSSHVVQTGPFGAQLHANDYVDEGIPLILIRNVGDMRIDDKNIPLVSHEDADRLSMYRIKTGDIVFSRVGSIGRIAPCTERENGWLISGQMLRLRILNPRLYSRFAAYAFGSSSVLTFVELQSVGSTRESINTDILRNMPIPIPPVNEQLAIAEFLDRETGRTDGLIEKIKESIKLLREYRQSLISAAVTGKIDVRATENRKNSPANKKRRARRSR